MSTADPDGRGNVLALLRSLSGGLVPSKRRVADAILTEPARAARWRIGELAEEAGTSQTTVLRLCHDLGFASFRDLRVALAAQSAREDGRGSDFGTQFDIQQSDSIHDVIHAITHADAAAVLETGDLLDEAAAREAVTLVSAARRIDIFGVGASSFVAMDLQQKLLRIGLIAFCWPDQHAALTATALLAPGDVAIGISHTGETRDTVDILRRAGSAGAATIAVTSAPRSHLAQAAGLTLVTASRETTFRSGAMASRIAALTVVDVLFVGVAQRRYESTLQALESTRQAVAHRRFGQAHHEG